MVEGWCRKCRSCRLEDKAFLQDLGPTGLQDKGNTETRFYFFWMSNRKQIAILKPRGKRKI